MKITFNTLGTQETERQYTDKRDAAKTESAAVSYAGFLAGSFGPLDPGPWSQVITGRERGKSLIELQQEAEHADIAVQQDYMTVMSHTMSQEDYARLSEEGFHFESLDPEEAVTIVDKIKAELARSGQHIVGYTDDLDMDTLAAAVGSDSLARTIADSFARADVPLTQENIRSVAKAWGMASQLEAPGEGAGYYMIDNGLEPEIWNLYLAQNSGAESMAGGMPRYYAEEIQGYFTRSAGGAVEEGMQQQMDRVIAEAGKEPDAESRQQAEWLMQKGLPLTAENLRRLDTLQDLAFPVSRETFAQAAVSAIAEGKEPIHANLARQENLYDKAARLAAHYFEDQLSILDAEDVTARRQLEEIRLRMTAEVNVKLLKSGFSIDTAPMEQLLEALKQAEAQLADSYFPGDAQAAGKYELYRQSTQVAQELPGLPLQLVGRWAVRTEQTDGTENITRQGTVGQFHAEGKALQQSFAKAQESYEALMTAPRSDLGDSIRKAFANVDEILADLGYEPTEENRRVVRILGYNRMAMSAENFERVKTVDARVRSVVEQMTPAATLKMIRDGLNPLEQSFEELEGYFRSLPRDYEESAEGYSRFLYQLEQHSGITDQEREAYIGIYRLLHQIEKSDGAVVGAVVNSQMEVQFKSLLAAARSNRFRHMDVRATDETGLTAELVKSANSISDQITDNIVSVSSIDWERAEAAQWEYDRTALEQIREASQAEPDSAALLQRGELPANAGNLLAAQALLHDVESPFRKWQEKARTFVEREYAGSEETGMSAAPETTEGSDAENMTNMSVFPDLTEAADETSFREAYREMLSGLAGQVEDATLNRAENSLDVRELQMIHKQLSVAAALADSQEYILPMYIGDELAKVHLTIARDPSAKGQVSVQADLSEGMHLEAHFSLSQQRLSGFLVGNTDAEVMKLQMAADIFRELLAEETSGSWEMEALSVVSGGAGMARSRETVSGAVREPAQQADNAELYQVAKLFLQALRK